jgi:hypothetical protein
MIFFKQSLVKERDFLNLLERVKAISLGKVTSSSKQLNGESFEELTFESCKKAAHGTIFNGRDDIERTGTFEFPDIIAKKYFGIEVKMTKADKWISTGNSILEMRRRKDVEKIYMFFGKMGGIPDIKYRPYADCLSGIEVTHQPRYSIDMNLKSGKTIFDNLNIPYEVLRKEKFPVKKIKNYYRERLKEGEELWWMDSDDTEKSVSPIILPYRSLSADIKKKYIAECFVLFPKIIGPSSNNKYDRAAAYLITEYNAVSASLRDKFSSKGKVELIVKGINIGFVSRVYKNLQENAKTIKTIISTIDDEKLKYFWDIKDLPEDKEKLWKNLIDKNQSYTSAKIKPSDIYEWGLN